MINIDGQGLLQFVNRSFHPILTNKDRYLILFGGAGSGKSVSIAQKIILRVLKAMNEGKQHKILCLRKTKPAAKNSIYPLFKEIIDKWNLGKLCKINKTTMTFTFVGGSEALCTGLDDPEKIKSIQGVTIIWIEEATEFTYDDFKQLNLRLRGHTWDYKQIILSFNPIDEAHWIREKLFTDKMQAEIESGVQYVSRETSQKVRGKIVKNKMTVMHSTYKDNQFIDDEYIALLENLIEEDTNYYNVYCLGRWGVLKGLIFEHWNICEEWPEMFDVSGFGLDFGFSINPSAIVQAGFVGDKLYLREHCYKPGMTNKEIAVELMTATENSPTRFTVADSAEPKSIVEIRMLGHPCVPAVKGPDSIVFGIQRMKQYKIHIYCESTNLIKEFQSYKWAEDKQGNPLSPPKPVKYNDHAIDACRYVVTKLKGMPAGLEISDGTGEKASLYDQHYRDELNSEITIDEDNPDIWDDL